MEMNDDQLREFFHSNRPRVRGKDEFLLSLSSKMDALSEIRRIQEMQLRQTRKTVLLAGFCGMMAGVVLTLFAFGTVIPFLLCHHIELPDAATMHIIKYVLMTLIPLTALVMGLIPWKRKGI